MSLTLYLLLRLQSPTSALQLLRTIHVYHLHSTHIEHWGSSFEPLTVQNNFLDIVTLEQACPLWKRLMFGLPEKQLLLLLRAGCDTLPTPMNLSRWNIITNPKCALCQTL